MYAWGELIQRYHGIDASRRLPSVTLTDMGYSTGPPPTLTNTDVMLDE